MVPRSRLDRALAVAIPALITAAIGALYVLTHAHPAKAGGLFLAMARTIARTGSFVPARIAHYTAGGIPYGYPPLLAAVGAAFYRLGVPLTDVGLVLPSVYLCLGIVAYYAFAAVVLDDRWQACLAAVVVALTPPVIQTTVIAGGVVRAGAFLLAFTTLATAAYAYRNRAYRVAVATALLFGLTALSHLKYAYFTGVSVLVLFLLYDRSARGFAVGAGIAVGGAVVSSVWWVPVIRRHGVGLLLQAAGTHGGLFSPLTWPYTFEGVGALWPSLILVAAGYLVVRGRWRFPLWFIAMGGIISQAWYALYVGALMVPIALWEVNATYELPEWTVDRTVDGVSLVRVLPLVMTGKGLPDGTDDRPVGTASLSRLLPVVFVVGLVAFTAVPAAQSAVSVQSWVHEDDEAAMAWIDSNTDPEATLVAVGDVREWLPYYTERTTLVAPRGAEWDERGFEWHAQVTRNVSTCLNADCVEGSLAEAGVSPDYLYVAKDGMAPWVVPANPTLAPFRFESLRSSFAASDEHDVVYENDTVIVVERTAAARRADESDDGSASLAAGPPRATGRAA